MSVCVCVERERQVDRNNSLVILVLHLCYTLYYIFVTYSMAFCPVFHFLAFCPDTGFQFHNIIFAANSSNMNDKLIS